MGGDWSGRGGEGKGGGRDMRKKLVKGRKALLERVCGGVKGWKGLQHLKGREVNVRGYA